MRADRLNDGEWFVLPDRILCCSCGLAHDIKARKRNGRVELSYTLNARATALTRRQHRYEFNARKGK